MSNEPEEGRVQDTKPPAPHKLVEAGLDVDQGFDISMSGGCPSCRDLFQIPTCNSAPVSQCGPICL